jgi:HD-GYP domain-containing protein (c-di-GMP phosphodiesterase class II)
MGESGRNSKIQGELVLRYGVNTLDGRQLLPAGTCLDGDVMERLACSAATQWQQASLLEYGTVRADLRRHLTFDIPYRNFPRDTAVSVGKGMEALMAAVKLPLPVLECLSYFRDNDYYSYRHVLAVFALYSLLAHDMRGEMDPSTLDIAAGPLHDIGKVCVPLSILEKRTPLRRAERDFVEHHAVAGYVLLAYYLKDAEAFAARVARDHHERRDGSGYQLGIRLQDSEVEMVAVCDIYDALVNPRPYRRGSFDNRTALEVITGMAEKGTVSWTSVRRLVAANRRDRPRPDACVVSLEKRGTPPAENNYGMIEEEVSEPPE